jgi:hypothetical protein
MLAAPGGPPDELNMRQPGLNIQYIAVMRGNARSCRVECVRHKLRARSLR